MISRKLSAVGAGELWAAQLERVLRAPGEAFRQARGVRIRVLRDHAAMAAIAPEITAQADYDNTVQAVLTGDRKTVYFIADRIRSIRQALKLFAHELVGHYSMQEMLGPALFGVLKGKILALRDAGQWPELFAEVHQRYERDAAGAYRPLDDATFASEAIAVFAENNITTSFVQRAANGVRGFLRAFVPDLALSKGELRQMLWEAGQRLAGHVHRPDVAARALGATHASPVQAEGVAFARSSERPPFYSALLRAVQEAQGAPKRAPALAWRQWLDGAQRRGAFKGAEREWIGVDAWLDGRGDTTRSELGEFVKSNQVQVRETVLGDDADDAGFAVRSSGGQWEVRDPDGNWWGCANEQEARAASGLQPAKFKSYQLPGGQHYRELLLTLPSKDVAARMQASDQIVEGLRINIEQMEELLEDADTSAAMREFHAAELADMKSEMDRRQEERKAIFADEKSEYQSPHWDQANVIAHVRFSEYADVEDKRVLVVQEVQSDWHQAGRKSGYATPSAPLPKRWTINNSDGDGIGSGVGFTAAEALASWQRVAGARASQGITATDTGQPWETDEPANTGVVPDAPLKREWPLTAMKRMLRWAAERGFDRVAWTTGQTQEERYDLSKQVDRIEVVPSADAITDAPCRIVYLFLPDGHAMQFVANGGGVVYGVNGGAPAGARGKSLDQVVGKEIAERIMQADGRTTFSGDDLRVGGAGMREFYDRMLPLELGKYVKQWNAKVGTIQLVGTASYDQLVEAAGRTGRTQAELDAMPVMERKALVDAQLPAVHVHSIDITPAMRAAVMGGQALFHKAYHGSPHDFDRFRLDASTAGTGEGNSAYGFGLYFASERAVADHYRETLAGIRDRNVVAKLDDSWVHAARSMLDAGHRRPDVLQALKSAYRDAPEQGLLDAIRHADPGRLYEVELQPDEAEYLDWDKPLVEQMHVVEALDAAPSTYRDRSMGDLLRERIARLASSWQGPATGRDVYRLLATEMRGESNASLKLLELGIPGIRYLDGNSRVEGSASRNFVIFDADLVAVQAKAGAGGDRGRHAGSDAPGNSPAPGM